MSWEVAKAAIDYILSHEDDMKEESVVWDFIGGEPFLEIDLIDKSVIISKLRCFVEIIIGSILIAYHSLQMVSIMTRRKCRDLSKES